VQSQSFGDTGGHESARAWRITAVNKVKVQVYLRTPGMVMASSDSFKDGDVRRSDKFASKERAIEKEGRCNAVTEGASVFGVDGEGSRVVPDYLDPHSRWRRLPK